MHPEEFPDLGDNLSISNELKSVSQQEVKDSIKCCSHGERLKELIFAGDFAFIKCSIGTNDYNIDECFDVSD